MADESQTEVAEPEAAETAEPANGEWRREVQNTNHRCLEAKRELDEATEAVKEAKGIEKAAEGRYHRLCQELHELIEDGMQGQGRLPFAAAADGNSEAWRDVDIDELELGNGIATALREAGIDTLGAIATHSQTGLLTDIEGIGEAKAKKIEDATLAWHEAHPGPPQGDDSGEPEFEVEESPDLTE